MTSKNLTIIIAIAAVVIISGIFWLVSCVPTPTEPLGTGEGMIELKLSDYPEVFSKDTIIVIGENASEPERESVQLIAETLKNSTGMKPQILSNIEIADIQFKKHNLILVGTSESNNLLNTVYDMTSVESAKRVTKEYPGENKGLLQMLNNPWNKEKALLIVAGSDVIGVKAGSEVLKNTEEVGKLKEKTLLLAREMKPKNGLEEAQEHL